MTTHAPAKLAIAPALAAPVSATGESPSGLVARLSAEGAEHLCVDGGRTIQSFPAAGSIDRITITTVPALPGSGLPLFGPPPGDVRLAPDSTRSRPFGSVQNTWRVER